MAEHTPNINDDYFRVQSQMTKLLNTFLCSPNVLQGTQIIFLIISLKETPRISGLFHEYFLWD